MDEHNVHQLWGLSPAIDLLDIFAPHIRDVDADIPAVKLLQVCSYDCRHVVQTICRADRHQQFSGKAVELYVYEDQPDLLARQMLLISTLLDERMPVRDRMEMFLEIHGNLLLREKTADYVDERSKQLETAVDEYVSKGTSSTPLAALFDLSNLKYQERDLIIDALKSFRKQVVYDAVKAWDSRSRKWYADRYDFRRNMIDWDYHMRLMELGTPGQDPAHKSIIHFYHFRHWREHGVAYELRDSQYDAANRTMITTAVGRTKEFKDRNGKDIGRKVAAWGFWGDILNSPYHCFGTVSEEDSFFKVANQQFSHTAVDVAEYNVKALVEELRTGELYKLPTGQDHRAKSARGPTSMEELEAVSAASSSEAASSEETGAEGKAAAESGAASTSGTAQGEEAAESAPSRQESEEELQAREAALNAAAWERCRRFKIVLVTGDLCKQLTGKAKFAKKFDGVTVGHRHVHLLGPQHKLQDAAKGTAALAAETGKYMVQLNKEQASQFKNKIAELAISAGWELADRDAQPVPDAHMLFVRAASS